MKGVLSIFGSLEKEIHKPRNSCLIPCPTTVMFWGVPDILCIRVADWKNRVTCSRQQFHGESIYLFSKSTTVVKWECRTRNEASFWRCKIVVLKAFYYPITRLRLESILIIPLSLFFSFVVELSWFQSSLKQNKRQQPHPFNLVGIFHSCSRYG